MAQGSHSPVLSRAEQAAQSVNRVEKGVFGGKRGALFRATTNVTPFLPRRRARPSRCSTIPRLQQQRRKRGEEERHVRVWLAAFEFARQEARGGGACLPYLPPHSIQLMPSRQPEKRHEQKKRKEHGSEAVARLFFFGRGGKAHFALTWMHVAAPLVLGRDRNGQRRPERADQQQESGASHRVRVNVRKRVRGRASLAPSPPLPPSPLGAEASAGKHLNSSRSRA